MADFFHGRDIDKVLVALKKGAQLLKYGRKGKPKFYQFKLSNDESSLNWLSSGGEKKLKLASVSKIVPGQRTPVFRRYLHPEKDFLSFSLIYNNGKRSLDLICKDKFEAELWCSGLKALISYGEGGRAKIDGWSDDALYLDDLISNSASNSSIGTVLDIGSPENLNSLSLPVASSYESLVNLERADVANMQVKGSSSDVFRISVSSAPSTSSHGSAQDDYEVFGDVYVWGEVFCDDSRRASIGRNVGSFGCRTDVLLPKPLESNLVLDVQQMACGVRHAVLVTKQGEVFTWGEESGGRLGHGFGTDVFQPCLVESLSACNIDFVACGEFHTCAVSLAGELYTWGDGAHNAGLLGHGTDISHWIPKRVSGPLEGLQVASISCGTWHTALITSTGQLFTFGDGTFGVLGHGNRESVAHPKEIESLMGLRTISVACGVWHTAAVVEVIVTQSSASVSSGKLFTWGDGDKYRLGHGDKEPRLKPTCVPSLIDHDYCKLACGHSLTIGLTTSGQIFTMGSTVYGQLGNPHSDGKLPCLVEDKLFGESVLEVACGSYHVAALTNRNEVYTWGKGANGRLGHGDIEDRKTPTFVEALRDRPVKRIACGSNFTAAICNHKWVSGTEQSQCTSCRQTFGFTRKRHNCYNCGLVHCHSCSSRKALRAALAPNPGKPYRVCDSCYVKLNKVLEAGVNNKKNVIPRLSGESRDRFERSEIRTKTVVPSNLDLIKSLDIKAAKQGRKTDPLSSIRASQGASLLQLKDIAFSGGLDLYGAVPRSIYTSTVQSVNHSRAVSPFSRKPSPPRSATPIPTTSGLSFSKSIADSLKKTNEQLNQEVQKLRAQVETLRQCCELQEFELQKSAKKAQDAMTLAAEESAKSKAAKEVIKSLTSQLKDLAERLPHGTYESSDMKLANLANGLESHASHQFNQNGEHLLVNDATTSHRLTASLGMHAATSNGYSHGIATMDTHENNEENSYIQNHTVCNPRQYGVQGNPGENNNGATRQYGIQGNPGENNNGAMQTSSCRTEDPESNGSEPPLNGANAPKPRSPNVASNQVEAEWIEQYESGVYITLVALRDGSRDLKRVRFSRRRFGEHQAETWWSENREKVYGRYNVRATDRGSSVPSTDSARRTEDELSHSSKV